jgi:argininosuccinate lyase
VELQYDADRMAASIDANSLATDVAESLVASGTPFREAHDTVAALVARLEAQGRTLADVPPTEWAAVAPALGPQTAELFRVAESPERRRTPGGPSIAAVKEQLVELRGRLNELARAS